MFPALTIDIAAFDKVKLKLFRLPDSGKSVFIYFCYFITFKLI